MGEAEIHLRRRHRRGRGHGLASTPQLAAANGITNVAVVEKGAIGLGNVGRNTTIVRSTGLVAIRVGARDARRRLGKGCRLDLHPRVFSPGDAARRIIAQGPTLLIQVDDGSHFDLFVPTTLVRSSVEHLLDAAAEFGCAILPAEERPRS